MMRPRRPTLVAVLLLAACTSGTTVVEVDVASVEVSSTSSTVEVGLTVQFTAEAFDVSGAPIAGQPVTWTSTVASVATIDADGIALGVAVGSTQIEAEIGGVTGSRTLTVEPAACPTRTDVVLAPGEYAVYQADECLLLPSGSNGDMYRVAIARPTLIANPSNIPAFTLEITPVAATAAAASEGPTSASSQPVTPRESALPRIDATQLLRHLEWQDATRAFHMELRMRERELGLGMQGLLPSLARTPAAAPAAVDPPMADSMYLDFGDDCSLSLREPVRLIAFDDRLAIYQDSVSWAADPISAAAAGEILSYYDLYVQDMIVDYWGPQPDVNADGRITIVTTPYLDEGSAAAVFSCDFYDTSQAPRSNEAEVIYFQAELIRLLDDADPDYFALGVVAHEAKHVTSIFNGIQRGGFNDLWIEEGTAEISQVMSSRIAWAATGGPAVNEAVTGQAIFNGLGPGNTIPRELSAVIDEVAGIARALSAQPNSVITDPSGAPPGHSFYLNSWLWHRFLGDGFGGAGSAPQADSSFFRVLIDPSTPAGGAAGELQLTGRTFEELFEDFVVAVSFHQTGYTPTRAITTWDLVSSADIFANPNPEGSFPWPVTATESGGGSGPPTITQWVPFVSDSFTGTIGPSGVRFHDFRSSGSAGAQISVTSSQAFQSYDKLIVSRID